MRLSDLELIILSTGALEKLEYDFGDNVVFLLKLFHNAEVIKAFKNLKVDICEACSYETL